jgi:general secretion pathway protein F
MQQELLGVLAAGTRAGLPLRNSVLAYAADRPSARLNQAWTHVLLFILLPGLNLFHHARQFRRKLVTVADALEEGAPLCDALCQCRGVASADTLLAAAAGEASGRLGEALERVYTVRTRHAHEWVALAVATAYPAMIVLLGNGITQFQYYFIVPKLEDLVSDYGIATPRGLELGSTAAEALNLLTILMVYLVPFAVALYFSSTLRWYTPGVAWYYRTLVRARVLESLGLLIEVERPLPEAFEVLAGAPQGRASRRRLLKASRLAGDGRPLVECLRRAGLLPRNSGSLLETRERSGNLPWATRELGEHLHRRIERRLNRLTELAGPLSIVALGGLFAFVCAGTFLSLVDILNYVGSVEYQTP